MIQLHEASREAEPEPPPLSSVAGLPLRFGVSFILASTAASGVAALVELVRIAGLVRLDTTAASLAARVGLPGVAFAVAFAFVFWYSGRQTEQPKITADMSDEEIARALNIKPSTAGVLLHRAKASLREALAASRTESSEVTR